MLAFKDPDIEPSGNRETNEENLAVSHQHWVDTPHRLCHLPGRPGLGTGLDGDDQGTTAPFAGRIRFCHAPYAAASTALGCLVDAGQSQNFLEESLLPDAGQVCD